VLSNDEDLIAKLRLTPEMLAGMAAAEVGKEPVGDAPRKPRRRVTEPFVVAEVRSLKAAADALAGLGCRALMVWLYLAFETKRRGTDTVQVSNVALAEWGVIRDLKYKALDRLEAAGLVSVKRSGKRSLRVTVRVGVVEG
jgi:hypothetical protein